jgi:Pyruvate/2-oxoacid:ferredoxin oxidoreductase delta subunit
MAQLEENQTGFYDAMKKAINKDACEECRFCHAEKAFCEDMKQTRASD